MIKTTNHNDDYAVKHCKTLALREAAFPRTHSAQTMRYSLSYYSIVRVNSSHPVIPSNDRCSASSWVGGAVGGGSGRGAAGGGVGWGAAVGGPCR